MNVIERIKAPTPNFFKVLRRLGLALLGISGSVIAAPVVLPSVVVSIAGYMAVAGGVISAVSQMTVGPSASSGNGSGNEDKPQQTDEPLSSSTSLRVTAQDESEINSG